MTHQHQHQHSPILLSILAAIITLGLKFTAYVLTGSVGLLSDALESLINLFAAVTAYLSLRYSAKPVDPSHTYGHEKIEFFSSGLEGVLILVAAAGIAWYAIQRLLVPAPLTDLDVGLVISLVASGINLAVARILLRVGRSTGSIVLEADGQHLMTDVWTSVAVVAGLGLVWLTGFASLDPILALIVSANILWTAWDLLRRSFNGLMDHALPADDVARLRAAIQAALQPGMDFHALRTREAGSRRFVEFHLLVPGKWTVKRAHEVTMQVEAAVNAALERSEITVHIEPIEDESAYEQNALRALEEAERRSRTEGDQPISGA